MQGREVRLGITDGFRYIGLKPGLSRDEMSELPAMRSPHGDVAIVSEEHHQDGTTTLGVEAWTFHATEDILRRDWNGVLETERFLSEAERFSAELGATRFDRTLRHIGSGSLFETRIVDAEI